MDTSKIAQALPTYEIGHEIGEGAFGAVLFGRHRTLERNVAIKLLTHRVEQDASARSRFLSEARLLASLDHPHLVPIYDYVEHEGLCLLVMEHLTGGTLLDRNRHSRLTPMRSCAVAVAALSGLQHAHQHGVIHRDVKPENLLFAADGTLKVSDFGIAKMLGVERTSPTVRGAVVGTPQYMAPEQAQGGEVGARADVYSTGLVLYELIAGQLPLPPSDDFVAMIMHRATQPMPDIVRFAPWLPEDLRNVVMRAVSLRPEDRQGSAEDLAVDVASAASRTWGDTWIATSGIRVLASDRVAAASRRPVEIAPMPVSEPVREEPPPAPTVFTGPPRRGNAVFALLTVLAIMLAFAGAGVAWMNTGDDPSPTASPSPTPPPTPTAAPGELRVLPEVMSLVVGEEENYRFVVGRRESNGEPLTASELNQIDVRHVGTAVEVDERSKLVSAVEPGEAEIIFTFQDEDDRLTATIDVEVRESATPSPTATPTGFRPSFPPEASDCEEGRGFQHSDLDHPDELDEVEWTSERVSEPIEGLYAYVDSVSFEVRDPDAELDGVELLHVQICRDEDCDTPLGDGSSSIVNNGPTVVRFDEPAWVGCDDDFYVELGPPPSNGATWYVKETNDGTVAVDVTGTNVS